MAVAAAYELSLALSNLQATIDASACWRALCAQPEYEWAALSALADAATSPTAATHVVEGACEGDPSPPTCFVRFLADDDFGQVSTTGFDLRGMILMTFEAHVPTAYAADLSAGYRWWTNVVGRIRQEMKTAIVNGVGLCDNVTLALGTIGMFPPDEFADGRRRMSANFTVHYSGEA